MVGLINQDSLNNRLTNQETAGGFISRKVT